MKLLPFTLILTVLFTNTCFSATTNRHNNKPLSKHYPNEKKTIYAIILPEITKKTHLQVILPPADTVKKEIGFDTLLAPSNINFSYHYAYSINYDYTEDCNGAPVCSAGSYYVAKLNTRAPKNHAQSFPLTAKQLKQIKLNQQSPSIPNHQPVKLNNIITGYIEDAHSTGIGSSLFQTLTWIDHNTVYQLTLKGIPLNTMVKIAQATLNTQARNTAAASKAK